MLHSDLIVIQLMLDCAEKTIKNIFNHLPGCFILGWFFFFLLCRLQGGGEGFPSASCYFLAGCTRLLLSTVSF
jgi:hypothetical protein